MNKNTNADKTISIGNAEKKKHDSASCPHTGGCTNCITDFKKKTSTNTTSTEPIMTKKDTTKPWIEKEKTRHFRRKR